MSTVQVALLSLTKPTTDSVKSTVGILLAHVCSSSSSSSTNTATGNQDDASANDIIIEASSVSQPLVVNLLGCKHTSSTPNAMAPQPLVQRAHALICVIDKILSFKTSSNLLAETLQKEFLQQQQQFDPQLISAAWGVLQRELESELPPIVSAVVSSFPQRQSAAMLLIIKRWLNERLVFSENCREALQEALLPPSARTQQQQQQVVNNVDDSSNTNKNENNNNDHEDDDAYAQMLSRQTKKITSAEAKDRIELLKHLCQGLESIPQGNTDALNLRNSLLEFGIETANKSGGTKRWGVISSSSATTTTNQNNKNSNNNTGGEVRALVAALEGHVDLKGFSSSSEEHEQQQNNNNNTDDENISKKSSTTTQAQQLLNEACDNVDDILYKIEQQQLEKEKQQKQQQQSAAAQVQQQNQNSSNNNVLKAATASTIANKKQPFSVPVFSSLCLDSGSIPNSTSASILTKGAADAITAQFMSILGKEREFQEKIRGPLPVPEIYSPYFVPPKMSENGRLAHRCWYANSEQWASARNSVGDLKWVIIEGINDQDYTNQNVEQDDNNEDAAAKNNHGGGAAAGGEEGINVSAAQAQNFFF